MSALDKYPISEELLEVVLKEEELLENAKKLSQRNQEKNRLESEKKTIVSQFSAKINSCDADIEKYSLIGTTGCESRMIKCETHYNDPEKGQKTLYRCDTKEKVRITSMCVSEINDLFINGLGDQIDEFVFKNETKYPMISNDDIDKNDMSWNSVQGPIEAHDLMTFKTKKDKEYRVLKGFDDKGSVYMLQEKIEVKPQEVPEKTEAPAEPSKPKKGRGRPKKEEVKEIPKEEPKAETTPAPVEEQPAEQDLGFDSEETVQEELKLGYGQDVFCFASGHTVSAVPRSEINPAEFIKGKACLTGTKTPLTEDEMINYPFDDDADPRQFIVVRAESTKTAGLVKYLLFKIVE